MSDLLGEVKRYKRTVFVTSAARSPAIINACIIYSWAVTYLNATTSLGATSGGGRETGQCSNGCQVKLEARKNFLGRAPNRRFDDVILRCCYAVKA